MSDTPTTLEQRKAALMEYRGAVAAACSACANADGILHRTLLPQSFRDHLFGRQELAPALSWELRRIDAALDFLEGTDRLKRE